VGWILSPLRGFRRRGVVGLNPQLTQWAGFFRHSVARRLRRARCFHVWICGCCHWRFQTVLTIGLAVTPEVRPVRRLCYSHAPEFENCGKYESRRFALDFLGRLRPDARAESGRFRALLYS
jgi:hypothetical protein